MNNRVLIYNCCDDEYTHFIPIYCASSLFSNDNIDIEIGVNVSKLSNDEELALEMLRKLYKDSRILIKYDFYKKHKLHGFDNATYNGNKMWSNTVRFVSEPEIKNKYTYINDIDVLMLMKNFYEYHIDIMKMYNTPYSNWVRDNDKLCLTGLHFVKSSTYYPINANGINLIDNDEHILKKLQSRVCEINYNIPRRPVCGLHLSKNQRLNEQLKLNKKFVEELNSYKESFFNFLDSEEYEIVRRCNTKIINDYINDFIKHYQSI